MKLRPQHIRCLGTLFICLCILLIDDTSALQNSKVVLRLRNIVPLIAQQLLSMLS